MPSICSVDDCTQPARKRGWCSKHYQRWLKHGDPVAPWVRAEGVVRECSIDGCTGLVTARGYCNHHANAYYRYGDPLVSRTRPLSERFWEKVDKDGPIIRPELGPCWIWTATRTEKGYGQIGRGSKLVRANRLSYEMANGPIDDPSLLVRHRCDNPPCVRPDHLELGTPADNSADMVARGRQKKSPAVTHCVQGHEYTPENTYRDKRGFRACITCRRERVREWRRAKRQEAQSV